MVGESHIGQRKSEQLDPPPMPLAIVGRDAVTDTTTPMASKSGRAWSYKRHLVKREEMKWT